MPFILRRLALLRRRGLGGADVNFFLPRAMPGNAVEAIMSKFPNLRPRPTTRSRPCSGVGHPGSLWHQYVSYLD